MEQTCHYQAKAFSYLKDVNATFQDQPEKYRQFVGIMSDYQAKKALVADIVPRIRELFKGHDDLIASFYTFLPKEYRLALLEDSGDISATRHTEFAAAIQFLNKVRILFLNDESGYEVFWDLLDLHQQRDWVVGDTFKQLTSVLQGHEDLLHELDRFLKDSVKYPRMMPLQRGSELVYHVKSKLGESQKYSRFVKCVVDGAREKVRLQTKMANMTSKYPGLMEELDELLKNFDHIGWFIEIANEYLSASRKIENGLKHQEIKPRPTREVKNVATSAEDLDQSGTPSYRLLPKGYPIPPASERLATDEEVLNDHLVSQPSGTEDSPFKLRHKNKHEEVMFRCEDDMFEFDMLFEYMSSAATKVEQLLEDIKSEKFNLEDPINIKEHLSVQNLRCIERIYGEHGLEILDILEENPRNALPVILIRLKQKQEEVDWNRSDFRKVCVEVFAKHHEKSLDMQQDCPSSSS